MTKTTSKLEILQLFFISSALKFFICPSEAGVVPGKVTNGTLTLGYLMSWSHEWGAGPFIGSAINLGIEEIKKRQLIPEYEIEWILADTWCQPKQGTKAAISIYSQTDDLDAFIGPPCSKSCQTVSLIGAAWGIPVISYSCTSDTLSDIKQYPNFARTVGINLHGAIVSLHVAKRFGWSRIGIISDKTDLYLGAAKYANKLMRQSGIETFLFTAPSTTNSVNQAKSLMEMRLILRILKEKCRVIFAYTYTLNIRNMLVLALEEDMLEGFIYLGIEAEIPFDFRPTFRPDVGLEVYEGVLDLEVSVPRGQKWDAFRQKVIDEFQKPEFDGWPHLGPDASIDQVFSYAGYLHDAVLLWAYGVNRTMKEGLPPDYHLGIIKNILGFSFEGITGTVALDSVGDRNSDYDVITTQNGKPVYLMKHSVDDIIKLYKPEDENDWSGLVWPGGVTSLPKDHPPCGWENEFCKSNPIVPIIAATCAFLVVVFGLIGLAVHIKRKRFQAQLQGALSCIIPRSEIQNIEATSASSTSLTASISSSGAEENDGKLSTVGRYNSQLVSLTPLHLNKKLDPKRKEVLRELNQVLELDHENLNPFIGISIDPLPAVTVMAYASRGNLNDVIVDSAFSLTWDIKFSLMQDITNGMGYLHSNYGWHGNLSCLTCFVDHRWICKIADYGFLQYKQFFQDKSEDFHKWIAPEFSGNEVEFGSKKGDVYCFAVICQEILSSSASSSPEGQNTNKNPNKKGPTAPANALDDNCPANMRDLLLSCLSENSNDRPTFKTIASDLNDMNADGNRSLVDRMIARLEAHSTRLEAIVAERTAELQEEKGRAELLLAELIPSSIAESLKRGEKIAPEDFDTSSIFFSDIVSFTKISAAGTPIDVVKMLNLMYTVFDDISSKLDVYKVATIGDAYFVASGVPIRNGNRHAVEICRMAVEMLEVCRTLEIPHIPGQMLRLRIGIHTGPCLAGVVGVKMPRYLLFGDTIDIASMMESGGEPMRIHISKYTAEILPEKSFNLQKRSDLVTLKGYGEMETYWLDRA